MKKEELHIELTKDDEEEIDEYSRLLTLDELEKIFGGSGGDERETFSTNQDYINKQIFGSKF